MRGYAGCQSRLQHLAKFPKRADCLTLVPHHRTERTRQGAGRNFLHDGACALPRFDQADQLEAADSIAYRTAAHAEHLCQFAFGWEFVARSQLFQDAPLDLLCDLFVDIVPTNAFEILLERSRHGEASPGPLSGPEDYTYPVK